MTPRPGAGGAGGAGGGGGAGQGRTSRAAGNRGGAGFILVVIVFIAAATLLYLHYSPGKRSASNVGDVITLSTPDLSPGLVDITPITPRAGLSLNKATDTNILAANEALEAGDVSRAVVLLRVALKDSPGDAIISRALASALNRVALKEFEKGEYARARELLGEAAAFSPDPAINRNLAAVLTGLDDLEGAAALLEPYSNDSKVRKSLKDIYVELGNRSYSRGSIRAAVGYYERALGYDPSDLTIKKALVKLRGEGESESAMTETEATHFLVRYEGGENAVTGHLIGILLEEAYYKIGSDFDFYPKEKVEALLYTRKRFVDVTRSPAWAGAIYDGRIKIPAGGLTEKTRSLEAAIFHEYTHALVHRLSRGRAPMWLNEGLAQYEEGRTSSDSALLLSRLANDNRIKLRSLEGSFMQLSDDNAEIYYLLSLSVTEYIIREFGIHSTTRLLKALARGDSLDDAVSGAVYLSYENLERSWVEALRRG